jgi:hypothetical protein
MKFCIIHEANVKTPTHMGLPAVSPHVRREIVVDHWCCVVRPEEDEPGVASGIRISLRPVIPAASRGRCT